MATICQKCQPVRTQRAVTSAHPYGQSDKKSVIGKENKAKDDCKRTKGKRKGNRDKDHVGIEDEEEPFCLHSHLIIPWTKAKNASRI
jgi:hypothetical protein